MTIGEAAGALLAAHIDKLDLDAPENVSRRREILQAIPAECRFILPDHRLAYLDTLWAVFAWAKGRPNDHR